MNSEEFVDAVKRHVRDAAIADTIANLKDPPGRLAPLQERIRSKWCNALRTEEVEHVNDVIAIAVHEALFGLLAALDGARTVDDEGGRFELAYVADERAVLNAPEATSLHDLLNAVD